MLVSDIQIAESSEGSTEVSAKWNGQSVYYQVPSVSFCKQALGDALVISILAPAMLAGEPIRLPDDVPVSSTLIPNLDKIQRTWTSWNVALRPVEIEAVTYHPEPIANGVGLFYAGGVDSSYSLISHLDDLNVLAVAYGYDFTFTDEQIQQSIRRHRAFADRLGKQLAPLHTNHPRFVRELVPWIFDY